MSGHVRVGRASPERTRRLVAQREREQDPGLVEAARRYDAELLSSVGGISSTSLEVVDPAALGRAREHAKVLARAHWDFEVARVPSRTEVPS
jgi:hypothetical protein